MGVRVDDGQGLQQSLRILMDLQDGSRSAFARSPAKVRRSRCAAWIAGVCSRPSSIGEHEAAIKQLLVDLCRGRRERDHHRAFDPVSLGSRVCRSRRPYWSRRS